jgi:autotransporter-associated beta strand protein
MKPRILNSARLSFPLATALAAMFFAHSAQAQTNRYWDQNTATAGFGSATGTWTAPTVSRWSTSNAGTTTPGASVTTLIGDPLHFGTDTVALATGSITVTGTVNAASLRFGSSTVGNVTLSGGIINLGATTSIHVGAGGTTVHTISSQITGAATSLTKTGNTLQLSGSNTFTGQTIISAGTLVLNNATALGGNTPGVNGTLSVTMAANTTLQSNFAPADAGNSNSFVYAPITLTGAGTANFRVGAGNSAPPAEAVTFNLNGAISGVAGTNVVLGNTAGDRGNADSIIVLGAASTYNGNTTIEAGNANNRINVRAGVANALPSTTVLSFESIAGGGTGRLSQYDMNGNNQTLAGLSNGGTVPSLRNHRVTNSGALATLTINNTGNFTFGGRTISTSTTNGQITGAIALSKSGSGTFTLTGANTYTGATAVTDGTLALSASGDNVGSINSTSGITINGSGAKLLHNSTTAITPTVTLTQGTLTGSGTVNTVNVGNNTGGIITNNDGVAGAPLTVGTLTFNGAATVNTFNSSTSAAIVTTSLASNAAGLVTINPSAPGWAAGIHDLISYGGGSIGGAGSSQFVLGTVTGLSPRQSSAFGNSGTAITLTVGADNPPFWAGDGDGKWNLASTNNWKLTSDSSYTTFLTSDNVLFNDSATGAGPVAVDIDTANVAPVTTTFNNPTKSYILGGAFGISSGSLTKSGSGTLTLTNANSYTGNTTITGGVLDVSTDGAQLYSGANPVNAVVTVGSGGVLVVRNFAQTNTSGAGSPSLGNLNNTSGRVVIDGGTLRFNNENASRGRVISVGPNGATLDVVNNSTYVWTTSPATSVPFTGSGQTLTLTGDATSTGQINPVIGGTNVSLVKSGDATWTLGGTNTYTGDTTIAAGMLSMSGNRIASSPTISIGNGATLQSTAAFTLAAGQDIIGTGTTGFVTMSPAGSNGFVTTSGTDISTSGTLAISRLDVRGLGNVISNGAILAGGAASNQRGLLVGNTVNGDLTLNSGASLTTGATGANSQDLLGNGAGTGTLVINGGTYTNTSGLATLQLGNAGNNGSGTLTLTSGSASIGTIAYQAGTGDGIVNLDGGTLTVGNIIDTSGASRIFNFNGGQFFAGAGVTLPANVTANVKNGGALIHTNGFSATIESPMVNFGGTSTGGLTKSGSGTLTLSGINTYAGGTSVAGGKLRFSTAAASATDVTVAGGAEAGALVAANDAQWINTGDLALQNSGAVLVDYGSTAPSITVAPVSVTDFSFGTTPGVKLAGSAMASLAVGQSYPLVTWSGSGPVDGSAFSLLTHRLSGTFSVASNTLSVTVTNNATNAPISWNTGNGNWDDSSINWVDGNLAATSYFDTLDAVVFGDAAGVTGSPVVTLATIVSPLNVTMNSTARNYTVSGAGSISGSGGLTLAGTNTGTFTLATANNTFSGGTSVLGGTLALGNATNTLPDSGAVTVDGASAVLSLGANSDTVGGISLKNGASITGTGGTLTGTSYALESGSVSAILGGSASLTKTTAGTVTLSAVNTYTGTTAVNAGTLVLANTGALQGTTGSVAFAIGTTLQLSTDTAFTTFPLFGASSGVSAITFTSDRATAGAGLNHVLGTPNLGANTFNFTSGANVTSGSARISFNGLGLTSGSAGTVVLNPTTATVSITGVVTSHTSNVARTLQLDGTGTGHSIGGVISQSVASALSLTKSNTSTWTLTGANTYTGNTTIDQGTLAFSTTDQTLTGGLTFGATGGSTNNGSLDLSTASATFTGAALVRTNSATANTITLGVGETLTLNGGLTVGYDPGSGSTTATKLTVDGGGSLAVNGTTIAIGQGLAANNVLWTNTGTLDVTSLASFSADVTNFNVGVGATGGTGSNGILLLSNTANTLIATTLKVGDTLTQNGGGGTTSLTLGTGTNVIQANTIEIGKGKGGGTGFRVAFASQTAGSPGTVTIADEAGTGAATINIANMGATGTGTTVVASLDLRGHESTVNASTLLIANSSNNTGTNLSGSTGTVHFDAGTFTVGTLNMGLKSGLSTGSANGTVNVGGGSFTVNTAFTLGSHSGGGASNATLNLTGGTFTSNVNILKGSSTANSTINLDGGILDLNGNAIGSGSAAITLTAESGTLRDVATINGTGGLTKTTAGTLIVEGTDPYSGDTTVTQGTLTLSNAAGALNANTINDASTVTIASTGATLNLAYTGTDLVDKLFVGATQLAAGTYGKVGSLSPVIGIPQITGDGTLTVATGPAGYGSWATLNGAGVNLDDDHDGDGVKNGVEYFLGGPSGNTTGFTALPGMVNTAGTLSVTWPKGTGYAGAYSTDFVVETSATLSGPWTVETIGGGNITDTPNPGGSVKYTFPGGPAYSGKNFARLKVTGP